jgi:hypothetical protein
MKKIEAIKLDDVGASLTWSIRKGLMIASIFFTPPRR